MEIQTVRKWYFWLWFSPLLTIPTLRIVYVAVNPYTFNLVCSQGCYYDTLFTLNGLIAIGFSSLWHLVLLIPSLNKDSQFVRWHGRQAMILAGVRTAIPLIFVLSFGHSNYSYLSILLLIPIWFFGTLWGQRQAARGDCSLMRWTGNADLLPGPPLDEEVDEYGKLQTETLETTFRFSNDPQERQAAFEELKERGLVEYL
jgi:hypothetical protein